jgi:hypothetical protein
MFVWVLCDDRMLKIQSIVEVLDMKAVLDFPQVATKFVNFEQNLEAIVDSAIIFILFVLVLRVFLPDVLEGIKGAVIVRLGALKSVKKFNQITTVQLYHLHDVVVGEIPKNVKIRFSAEF